MAETTRLREKAMLDAKYLASAEQIIKKVDSIIEGLPEKKVRDEIRKRLRPEKDKFRRQEINADTYYNNYRQMVVEIGLEFAIPSASGYTPKMFSAVAERPHIQNFVAANDGNGALARRACSKPSAPESDSSDDEPGRPSVSHTASTAPSTPTGSPGKTSLNSSALLTSSQLSGSGSSATWAQTKVSPAAVNPVGSGLKEYEDELWTDGQGNQGKQSKRKNFCVIS